MTAAPNDFEAEAPVAEARTRRGLFAFADLRREALAASLDREARLRAIGRARTAPQS